MAAQDQFGPAQPELAVRTASDGGKYEGIAPPLWARVQHRTSLPVQIDVFSDRSCCVYPLCATQRLVRTVGASKASRRLFTGRLFDAETALAMNIVDETVAEGEAFVAAWREAEAIIAVSQFGVRVAKAEMLLLDTMKGVDFREGSAAFVAKRAPHFTYR